MNADEVAADATGAAAEWKRVQPVYAGEPVPDWALDRFERGDVPMDEPPGVIERMYKAWRAAGGTPRPRAINLPLLAAELNYLRPGHPITRRVFEVCAELTRWIIERAEYGNVPMPFVEVSVNYVALTMDGESLWSSDTDTDEDLTLDACRDAWRSMLEKLWTPFKEP